jgi:hypothetical protein
MIKYKNFIFEKNNNDDNKMLIVLSLGLRRALKHIKQSDISIDLINTHKDSTSSISYIDLTNDIDKVSYIKYNRIADIFKQKDINPLSENIYNLRYGWIENREIIKIGKLINKLFPDRYSKKEIEYFINLFKSYMKTILSDINFDVVYGRKMNYWYLNDNYLKGGGTLNRSCLRKSNKNNFVNFLSGNPKLCRLLILKNSDNKLLGRSLMWRIGDKTYMDRIYTRFDEDVNLFIDLAKKKKWLYKSKQTYGDVPIIDTNTNTEITSKLYMENFKKINFDGYPYMDTFQYYNPKTFTLTNDETVFYNGSDYIKLNQVDGSYQTYEDNLNTIDIDMLD